LSDDGGVTPRAGEFRRMRIRKAHDYDLVGDLTGELLETEASAIPLFPILASPVTPGASLPHR
jgi:hypothetical protein